MWAGTAFQDKPVEMTLYYGMNPKQDPAKRDDNLLLIDDVEIRQNDCFNASEKKLAIKTAE